MQMLKRKHHTVQDDKVDENGKKTSTDETGESGGDGGREFDATYTQKMKSLSHKAKLSTCKALNKTKKGSVRIGKNMYGALKYIGTPNEYKKYITQPTKGACGHHPLFCGGGWRDFTWILRMSLILFPMSALVLAPAYAVYAIDVGQGMYKNAPHVAYNPNVKENYRESVRKRHKEDRARKKLEKVEKKIKRKENEKIIKDAAETLPDGAGPMPKLEPESSLI